MKKYLGFIAATVMLVEGFGVGAAIAGGQYGAVATAFKRGLWLGL